MTKWENRKEERIPFYFNFNISTYYDDVEGKIKEFDTIVECTCLNISNTGCGFISSRDLKNKIVNFVLYASEMPFRVTLNITYSRKLGDYYRCGGNFTMYDIGLVDAVKKSLIKDIF